MAYRFDTFRAVIALLALGGLIFAPWLSLTATTGNSIDYKIFKVTASTDSGDLTASYPEMVLRYQEGEKSIDVALASKLAPYMKIFQMLAMATLGLLAFLVFAENQKRLYLASGVLLIGMVLGYLVIAYHITSSLHLIGSILDLIFGKALKVQVAFLRTYLTLQLGWGWWLTALAGIMMLVYGWRYRYWKLVAMW